MARYFKVVEITQAEFVNKVEVFVSSAGWIFLKQERGNDNDHA